MRLTALITNDGRRRGMPESPEERERERERERPRPSRCAVLCAGLHRAAVPSAIPLRRPRLASPPRPGPQGKVLAGAHALIGVKTAAAADLPTAGKSELVTELLSLAIVICPISGDAHMVLGRRQQLGPFQLGEILGQDSFGRNLRRR
ncbi:hypothetical protein PMIN02_011142 [Paraphaeosphaeria minitans]